MKIHSQSFDMIKEVNLFSNGGRDSFQVDLRQKEVPPVTRHRPLRKQ